ncbi:MAG: hypothetical protein AAFQ95_02605 [Cyanobacteria bacterium J06621_3]
MSFTFIIPVIHPKSVQVSNYSHVEIVLRKTLESLKRQSFREINIVVVCCQIPSWASTIGDNIFFLDVSESDAFKPNPNSIKDASLRRYDLGLKVIVGALYAISKFETDLFMRVDADDYINTQLAEYSLSTFRRLSENSLVDGYKIKKGLAVEVSINQNHEIKYGSTYLMKDFDRACGSCHILKKATLAKYILKIDQNLFRECTQQFNAIEGQQHTIPKGILDWLGNITKQDFAEEWHPVNILGRHVKLESHMNFLSLPFLGASKACGHGNHVGPRKGGIYKQKVIGQVSTRLFKYLFGVQKAPKGLKGLLNVYLNVMFFTKLKQERIKQIVKSKTYR